MSAETQNETTQDNSRVIDDTYLNIMWMGGINTSTDLNFSYLGGGYAVQYGNWFSPQFATQLTLGQIFSKGANTTNYSIDFVWNLTNIINERDDSRLSFMPLVAFDMVVSRDGSTTCTYPMIDVGAQIKYDICDALNLIIEARVGAGYDRNDPPIFNYNTIRVGLGYKFNKPREIIKEI